MSSPIQDNEIVRAAVEDVGEVLTRHFGKAVDVVLILRDQGICRTVFGASPENDFQDQHPREVMSEVLEQAVVQNRKVNAAIMRRH